MTEKQINEQYGQLIHEMITQGNDPIDIYRDVKTKIEKGLAS